MTETPPPAELPETAAEAPPDAAPAGVPAETPAAAHTREALGAEAPAAPAPAADPAAEAPAGQQPPPARPELTPAACAALLAQHFPALFGAGVSLPIKLRIQADIQQRAPGVFGRKALSLFLHRHTTSTAYIRALLQAPHRFDLDGAAAGEVSEEHRLAATEELARRREITLARRAAERKTARPEPAAGRMPVAAEPRTRSDRTDTADGDALPARGPRPQRPQRPPMPPAPRRPAPRSHTEAPQRAAKSSPLVPRPQPTVAREPAPPAASPREPVSDEQRARAALLRAYESTTLTNANFCALKGIALAQLDELLALARRERSSASRS